MIRQRMSRFAAWCGRSSCRLRVIAAVQAPLAVQAILPERAFPSLFEPVHGSAPDIYGRAIANPIGQIWSGAMMLEHLGEVAAAAAIVRAIESVLEPGSDAPRTPDIGGKAQTDDLGKAIAEAV
jgi:tartrate dehydrogenase/decarboxylase/D-malate dehydrogenase